MSARVRVRHHGGRLAAVKVGIDPNREVELVREAAMLTAARHPGVVRLLGLTGGPDGLELITAWVGTRSLADASPLTAGEGAGVIGALASTVADLHRHGIVHGSIEPSHVLLDERGRPILCSFGHARLVARTGVSNCPRPSDDVAAIGETLAAAVGAPDDPELVPSRRFRRRQDHHLHREVLTIADHARAHDSASRPSAASLAAALATLVPAASLPADITAAPPLESRSTHSLDDRLGADLDRLRATAATVPAPRRRWPFVAGTVAVALLAIGVVGLWSTGTPSRAQTAAPAPAPAAVTIAPATTTASPAPAPVVVVDHQHYQVGNPGDRASVAPWRCDGDPRVVLLRPATGEVFLFDAAPSGGADALAHAFTVIDGAVDLAGVEPDDPCPVLVVHRGDRSAVPVSIPEQR